MMTMKMNNFKMCYKKAKNNKNKTVQNKKNLNNLMLPHNKMLSKNYNQYKKL